MNDDMTGGLERRRLYGYIGKALDAVAEMRRGDVYGNDEAFLAQMYSRRMASVFGVPADEDGGGAQNLNDVVARLDEVRRSRSDDLLPAHSGKIEVDGGFGPRAFGDRREQEFDERRFDAENDLGIEAYATYLPIHFFPGGRWRKKGGGWGIYISEAGVRRVARIIEGGFVERYGEPRLDGEASFLRIAFEVLLRHEMVHFKVESFALSAELQRGKALYVPYLMEVYATTYPTSFCLEEALANCTVLDSTVIRKLVFTLYPQKPRNWWVIIAKSLFDRQPEAYANYDFVKPWQQGAGAASLGLPDRQDRPRREAVNLLCNQIVSGTTVPTDPLLPFYAFPPDNFFLRAESLVPVYILKDLDDDRSFIHFRTPTWKVWEKFLLEMGFRETDKPKGRHFFWQRPGFGKFTCGYHGKDLDSRSFHTALRTLGISRKEFDCATLDKDVRLRLRQRLDELCHKRALA